jgi:hypothetical protein
VAVGITDWTRYIRGVTGDRSMIDRQSGLLFGCLLTRQLLKEARFSFGTDILTAHKHQQLQNRFDQRGGVGPARCPGGIIPASPTR